MSRKIVRQNSTNSFEQVNIILHISSEATVITARLHLNSNTSGYCLNDEDSLKTEKSAEASSGYLGNEYESIIIPQYISIDNGVSWTEVTNLDWTFFRFTRLKEIDKIPSTVKSMRYTFRNCD